MRRRDEDIEFTASSVQICSDARASQQFLQDLEEIPQIQNPKVQHKIRLRVLAVEGLGFTGPTALRAQRSGPFVAIYDFVCSCGVGVWETLQ